LTIFGVTVSATQSCGGVGLGVGLGAGLGFGFGGFVGAGTTVTADAVLFERSVSLPPPPVTVAVFTCSPTVVARAVAWIVTVCPGAIEPRLQVMSEGVTWHVPCEGFALR
jgi:hypothetical protein